MTSRSILPVRSVLLSAAALTTLLMTGACKRTEEPEPTPREASVRPPTPSTAAEASDAGKAASLVWTEPTDWAKETQPRPMRVATYRVPKQASGDDAAELAVFHFGPGDGGGIEANVQRWIGQFSEVASETVSRNEQRSSSGLVQHVVEIPLGTYASGMPGGPTKAKPNYGLLGAIVESHSGSYFFKLTGPAATLKEERARFFELLDSVRPAN